MFKNCLSCTICIYENSTSENDCQPKIHAEDLEDKNNDFAIGLPKNIVLEKSCGVMTG